VRFGGGVEGVATRSLVTWLVEVAPAESGNIEQLMLVLGELVGRGVALDEDITADLYGLGGKGDRKFALKLVAVGESQVILECMNGSCRLAGAGNPQAMGILEGLSGEEKRELCEALAKKGICSWRAGVEFLTTLVEADDSLLARILDTVDGALGVAARAEEWERPGERKGRAWDHFVDSLSKIGADEGMARALLAEHSEMNLDDLVGCVQALEAGVGVGGDGK